MAFPNRPRFPRSSVTGNIPAEIDPGSLAVNWTDKKIYVGNAGGQAVKFSQLIEDWTSTKAFKTGDIVIRNGDIYRAVRNLSAGGGFVLTDWERLTGGGRSQISEPFASSVYEGGLVTKSGDRKISITQGSGVVINNTVPDEVAVTPVSWSAISDFNLNYPGEAWSVIQLTSGGFVQSIPYSAYNEQTRRQNIRLAFALWDKATANIVAIYEGRLKAASTAEDLRDLYFSNGGGFRIEGAIPSLNADLSMAVTSGLMYVMHYSQIDTPLQPSRVQFAASDPIQFKVIERNDVESALGDELPVNLWDNAGTVDAVPPGNVTIQYLFAMPEGDRFYVVLGQTLYPSISTALNEMSADWEALELSTITDGAILLAAIVVPQGATDLSLQAQLRIAQNGATPFIYVSGTDDSLYYYLDGSRALQGPMDAGGNAIVDADLDGAESLIRPLRSMVTGDDMAVGLPSEFGEFFINITDKKLYARDDTGASVVVADRIDQFKTANDYAVGDFCIESNTLYLCTQPVTAGSAFDPLDWVAVGGSGGGAGSIVTNPTTLNQNTINTTGNPAVHGLRILGDPAQSADLLTVPGTQALDTEVAGFDSLGFPLQKSGSVVWRQGAAGHGFTAVGQAASFDGSDWQLADAGDLNGKCWGIVQQIIGPNVVVLRAGGILRGIQAGAVAGGALTPGSLYYVSDAVPGQLTAVEPSGARSDAVLFAVSATEGVVIVTRETAGAAFLQMSVSDTPPLTPNDGDLWYRTDIRAGLYVWYDSGPGQWVQTN